MRYYYGKKWNWKNCYWNCLRTTRFSESEVNTDSSFVDDLGADSLDTVELVMALEEEFDLEIADEDAEKISTVQEAVDYIVENS